jgi:hypothetical protein
VAKKMRKFITLTLIACLCVLGVLLPVIASDNFAPSWLKEDAYVKYVSYQAGSARVFDVTNSQFAGTNYMLNYNFDSIRYSSASFMWRCVSVNGTMARLQVTFDYVGEELCYWAGSEQVIVPLGGESLQLVGEAYVNLYNRAVYNVNGILLGTTHLWLPANPNNSQEIIVWDADSEKTLLSVITDDTTFTTTIQGKQDGFLVNGAVTIKGQQWSMGMFYDLDTGLGVDGSLLWDPLMAVAGIAFSGFRAPPHDSGLKSFAETNIDLGPERSAINWIRILQYSILPVTILLIVSALIIKHKKKKN